MPLSSLTTLAPIADGSGATPGLWNTEYSKITKNFAELESFVVSASNLSTGNLAFARLPTSTGTWDTGSGTTVNVAYGLNVASTLSVSNLIVAGVSLSTTTLTGPLRATSDLTVQADADADNVGRIQLTVGATVRQSIATSHTSFTHQYGASEYISDSNAINWNNGNVQVYQLVSGAQSVTFANPRAGSRYMLHLDQPTSGAAATVSWPATVAWPNATAPTLTSTNSRADVFAFVYRGDTANYLGSSALSFNLL